MFSSTAFDGSDDEDEGCYVVWKSTSVLETCGALLPPPSEAGSARRPSERSGAPSPSFGTDSGATTATGTPKPKRTTAAASLPSPSAASVGGEASQALRQQKRRKAPSAASRRRTAASAPIPSGEPLDARTLEMVAQLGRKIQARSVAYASPAGSGMTSSGGRTRARSAALQSSSKTPSLPQGTPSTSSKSRSPLRQSTLPNLPACGASPLRQTSARKAPQPPAQATLSLSATKPALQRTSPLGKSAGPSAPPARAKVSSPLAKPPRKVDPPVADPDDEYDDYFAGDESFELALSQLEDKVLYSTPPVPSCRPVETVSVKTAGSLAADTRAGSAGPPGRATAGSLRAPSPKPKLPLGDSGSAAQPPAPCAAAPAAAIVKGSRPPTSTQTVSGAGPSQSSRPLVRTTSSSHLLSAAERAAMEALARKEIESLAMLDDNDLDWDDEDDLF